MSLLNQLISITTKPKKRVGRGYGSGKGSHTSTRGTKGLKSRVGGKVALWFEGGQLPLVKRLPMIRGKARFKALNPAAEITLNDLQNMSATVITLDTLKLEKVIDQRFKKAKVIATGSLSRAVTVKGIPASAAARQQIEKAGGSLEN
ncbi:MAG TPA: 50S ribosomal protein L15 [Vitreimonas sp.]|nr:50S ribosomal protein L15 [Vitreimonas sp.]